MLKLIVNPIAGNGRSLDVAQRAEEILQKRSLPYTRVDTQYPGHATELAAAAVQEHCEGILSVGGDGTLSEIVSAIAGGNLLLYVVPCGTGNDFVKTLKLPKDPIEALNCQLDSEEVRLDVGEINGRRFINTSGMGFDVDVLIETLQYKDTYQGLKAYLLGVLSAIRRFVAPTIQLTIDGSMHEKRITLIEISNGQYIGGGMRVAPTADPTDGLFDVCYVDAVPRYCIPFLLPLFIFGWYRHLPITHVLHVRSLAIGRPGTTVNIDGDLIVMDRADYRLLPGALRMRCPLPQGFAGSK